ncbi:Trypsin AiT9, partial [Operophtera brumata]
SGGSSSEQLRHVAINVINQQVCAARYAYLKTQPGYQNWPDITDGMLTLAKVTPAAPSLTMATSSSASPPGDSDAPIPCTRASTH